MATKSKLEEAQEKLTLAFKIQNDLSSLLRREDHDTQQCYQVVLDHLSDYIEDLNIDVERALVKAYT